MNQFKLDHVSAMEWPAIHIEEDVANFLENYAHLPWWGKDIDRQVKVYILMRIM
jgi:hypothetical protein